MMASRHGPSSEQWLDQSCQPFSAASSASSGSPEQNPLWCEGYQLIVNGTVLPALTVNSPTVVSSGVPRSATGVLNWIAFGPAIALNPPRCDRTQGMPRP